MIPWILLILLILVQAATLPTLLKKTEIKSPLAYIPILHFLPWLRVIHRPWYWFILLLIPGVNLIMFVIINVEMGIAFNKRATKDQWFFGILPWAALFLLAFRDKEAQFVGPRDWTGKKKSFAREWGEAIVFAVVAASIIRTFFVEAFTIPTGSMEKSMLVGDFLFVSKMAYGAKVPQTPVSLPFVHNALPGGMTNSYTNWFTLPYFRLPGYSEVHRFDPVVFNYPYGDTIIVDPYFAGHNYYEILRGEAMLIAGKDLGRPMFAAIDTLAMSQYLTKPSYYESKARENFESGISYKCAISKGSNKPWPIEGIRYRPMDKKENYIKRCIGLPGDNLSIEDRQVMINDQAIENPAGLAWNYIIQVKSAAALARVMDKFSLVESEIQNLGNSAFNVPLSLEQSKMLEGMSDIIHYEISNEELEENNLMAMYPNSAMEPFIKWTVDNYGPIHIPAMGEQIELTLQNVELYKRIIHAYEGNDLELRDGKVFINGVESTTYTFKDNYYWMMGDNRHHSADSRFWGFVPETHLVGRASFTWFSRERADYHGSTKVRWNRMFRFVH
ncbi:MAG: S26 family signal peptidase [Flavobacteriales bacterium]|nr:S26 family signal peptidase [Flavobacteriales bacterium]